MATKSAAAIEHLLPAYCLICDGYCGAPVWLCDACLDCLPRNTDSCPGCALPNTRGARCPACQRHRPPFLGAQAPLRYEGGARKLIQQWKFNGDTGLTSLLVSLALPYPEALPDVDMIVPVPMHWWRRLRRGYNQSDLLAHQLALTLNRSSRLPVTNVLSARVRRRPQHRLGKSARLDEAADQFRARLSLNGERILLVDDVMTTGATLGAAATMVLKAGAGSVHTWCLARTP